MPIAHKVNSIKLENVGKIMKLQELLRNDQEVACRLKHSLWVCWHRCLSI